MLRFGPTCGMLSTLVLLYLPSLSLADDGVLEISQTCAVVTGCFAGDTAGFPVTIAAAGSYRLTSNLVLPSYDTDGIRISTSDVGIDLNRFAIITAACLDQNSICRPNSGSGTGIETTSTNSRGISVRNGNVTGMGDVGVSLGEQAEVSDLLVRWCGRAGIVVDLGSTVSKTLSYANGGDGIVADSGSSVSDSTIYNNAGDGIDAGSGCSIQRNTVRSNTGVALRLDLQSAFRENTLTGNGGGCVIGGVNLGDNSCNGSSN